MFRRQSLLAIAIAAVLGLVAVVLVNAYLSGVSEQVVADRPGGATRIVVARVPLEFGARLAPENLAMAEWPAGSIPPGSFNSATDLVQGPARFVMRSIGPGEPVLASRISDGGRPSVAAMLGPNMTAVSIRISDVSGVAGFVLAGDRVDVILTREVNEEQFTDVLLHNVRVVAIDQQANENRSEMTSGEAATLKTATLEVNQDDAQKLALGSAVGTLTLALRSPRQTQPETAAFSLPLRASQLVGGGTRRVAAQVASQPAPAPRADLPPRPRPRPIRVAATPPPQPRPSGPLVEVVRGTASRQYEVVPYGGL